GGARIGARASLSELGCSRSRSRLEPAARDQALCDCGLLLGREWGRAQAGVALARAVELEEPAHAVRQHREVAGARALDLGPCERDAGEQRQQPSLHAVVQLERALALVVGPEPCGEVEQA